MNYTSAPVLRYLFAAFRSTGRPFHIKFRLGLIFLCILILLTPSSQSRAANTITGTFELTVEQNGKTDVSSGYLYSSQNGALKIRVTDPLEQWMIFEGDTLTIYYPKDNSGIKIPSIQGNVSLPIFQLAINAGTDNIGLTEIGYGLLKTSVVGDSIIAIWSPPEETKKIMGNLTSIYIRDSLKSLVSVKANGDTVLEQTYSDYISEKGRIFPCRIHSVNIDKDLTAIQSIIFKDVILGTELPEEAKALIIPEDADLTTVQW